MICGRVGSTTRNATKGKPCGGVCVEKYGPECDQAFSKVHLQSDHLVRQRQPRRPGWDLITRRDLSPQRETGLRDGLKGHSETRNPVAAPRKGLAPVKDRKANGPSEVRPAQTKNGSFGMKGLWETYA